MSEAGDAGRDDSGEGDAAARAAGAGGAAATAAPGASARPRPSLAQIARVFAVLGATSFGGGVVAYLRQALVARERWFDDEEFLRLLELSQTLPGLNAVNMAVLAGDELRGGRGAVVGGLAMTIPGVIFVLAIGAVYAAYAHTTWMNDLLAGAAAAAVGLLLATTLQLGKKQFQKPLDLVLVLVTAITVAGFKVSLPWVIPVVGGLSVWLYRPRRGAAAAPGATS